MHADVRYWPAIAVVYRASRISLVCGDNEKNGYFISDFVIFAQAKYTAGSQDYSYSMKRRQTSLSEAWSKTGPTSSKKPALALEAPAEIERQDEMAPISSNEYDKVSSAVVSDLDTCTEEGDICKPNQGELCKAACCASDSECFQPVEKPPLAPLEKMTEIFYLHGTNHILGCLSVPLERKCSACIADIEKIMDCLPLARKEKPFYHNRIQ